MSLQPRSLSLFGNWQTWMTACRIAQRLMVISLITTKGSPKLFEKPVKWKVIQLVLRTLVIKTMTESAVSYQVLSTRCSQWILEKPLLRPTFLKLNDCHDWPDVVHQPHNQSDPDKSIEKVELGILLRFLNAPFYFTWIFALMAYYYTNYWGFAALAIALICLLMLLVIRRRRRRMQQNGIPQAAVLQQYPPPPTGAPGQYQYPPPPTPQGNNYYQPPPASGDGYYPPPSSPPPPQNQQDYSAPPPAYNNNKGDFNQQANQNNDYNSSAPYNHGEQSSQNYPPPPTQAQGNPDHQGISMPDPSHYHQNNNAQQKPNFQNP